MLKGFKFVTYFDKVHLIIKSSPRIRETYICCRTFVNIIGSSSTWVFGLKYLVTINFEFTVLWGIIWISKVSPRYFQTAVNRWDNVGTMLRVLLAQGWKWRWAMSFCHRPNVIDNNWIDVGPTSITQQVLHMLLKINSPESIRLPIVVVCRPLCVMSVFKTNWSTLSWFKCGVCRRSTDFFYFITPPPIMDFNLCIV